MTDAPQTDEQLAKSALCAAPDDLHGQHARELIGRSCRSFLETMRATPTELLFSAELQRKLADTGTAYAGAVQKIAIAQVSGNKNRDVAGRIKELYALCDAVRDRVLKAVAEAPAEALTPAGFAALPGERAAREFRLNLNLAQALLEQKGWADKAALLLSLLNGDVAAADQPPLDKALAEIARVPAGLDALVGKQQKTVGPRIDLLYALAQIKPAPNAPAPDAPILQGQPALTAELAALLARHKLPATRGALRGQIVAAVTGTYPLTGTAPDIELAALQELARKLRDKHGQFIGGEATEAALARRMSRLINDETIYQIMGNTPRLADRLRRCLELYAVTVGEQNLDYLKKYIDYLLQDRTILSDAAPKEATVVTRLRAVTEMHQMLGRSPLSEVFAGKLALRLEEAQARLIEESAIFDKVVKRGKSSADKALAMLDLCRSGTLIDGPDLRRARELAQRYMKQEDFLPSFLAGIDDEAEKKRRLVDLHQQLLDTGLAGA
ncbi:hypothetical protein [Oceanibaculum pacificum]|uniref:Uncharacterized protein n=1 Tax=Oceanibaculum pacificum TaxID=580166 RepID=A0A154VTX3_9PROT|nr:hypothetical protein [Oceanibaculum pacificum]KZD04690.1 hypothetical protein AUP43_12210 [Oceanibaculum pacificum]